MSITNITIDSHQVFPNLDITKIDDTICKSDNPKKGLFLDDNKHLINIIYLNENKNNWSIEYLKKNLEYKLEYINLNIKELYDYFNLLKGSLIFKYS